MSQADLQAAIRMKMSQVAPAQASPQQQAEQAFAAADAAMAANVPGWEQIKPSVLQTLAEHPELHPAVPTPQALLGSLDAALTVVRGQQIAQQAQRSADMTQQKLAAQTMSGSGQRMPAPTTDQQWAAAISDANESLGGLRLG